jgi:hypothetical protein
VEKLVRGIVMKLKKMQVKYAGTVLGYHTSLYTHSPIPPNLHNDLSLPATYPPRS